MVDKVVILDKIKEIKQGNEFIPEEDSNNWEQIQGKDYFIYKDPPKIEYELNSEIIAQAEECLKLQSKVTKNNLKYDKNKTIFKVYKLYDTNHLTISYTTTTIYKSLIDKIINLIKIHSEIPYFKAELIAIYKGEIERSELNIIKKEYENSGQESKSIIEIYEELIEKISKTSIELEDKYYYIYSFMKGADTYIYGTNKKLNSKEVIQIIKNNNIELGKIKFKILEKIKYKYTCEAYIKIDKIIIENNTINRYYNIVNEKYVDMKEIEKDIFLSIQADIMRETYEDKYKYREGGIICCIETQDKQKYIFYGKKDYTIKNKLNELYSIGRINNPCTNKIRNILYTIPFNELKIYIIEQNIPENQLVIRCNEIINKMHTYNELNQKEYYNNKFCYNMKKYINEPI